MQSRGLVDLLLVYMWAGTVVAVLFTLMGAFAMDASPAMSLLLTSVLWSLLYIVRDVHPVIRGSMRIGLSLAAGCFLWFVIDAIRLFSMAAR